MPAQPTRGAPYAVLLCLIVSGCGADRPPEPAAESVAELPAATGRAVETTGKQATALDAVPQAVLAAARHARPELTVTAAEHEVRDGREYYDVAGTLPDASELELDLVRDAGVWQVIEVQRDLGFDAVPEQVRSALPTAWQPGRIIESDQGGGLVIYEFFGSGPEGREIKREVRWENGFAELLEDEWMH